MYKGTLCWERFKDYMECYQGISLNEKEHYILSDNHYNSIEIIFIDESVNLQAEAFEFAWDEQRNQFYLDYLNTEDIDKVLQVYLDVDDDDYDDTKEKLCKSIQTIKKKNFRFMPEVSHLQKQEVIAWWSDKDYDLKIESHRHNCLFCIEKPHGTIMLAIKECPDEAQKFLNIVESGDVAYKPNRKEAGDVMYRKGITFRYLYEKTQKMSLSDVMELSRMGQEIAKKNPCTAGECSPFGDIYEEDK